MLYTRHFTIGCGLPLGLGSFDPAFSASASTVLSKTASR
jgi:hypothetical protein